MRFPLAVAAVVMSFAVDAGADDAPLPPRKWERVFGIGTVLGGGFAVFPIASSTGSSTSTDVEGAILAPSIELEYFATKRFSINLSLPLTNIAVASAVLQGVSLWAQLLGEINVGEGLAHGVFGLGLGFDYVNGSLDVFLGPRQPVSGGGIQFPAEVGLELLSAGKGFGFKLLARPYIETAYVSPRNEWVTGGAVLFLLGFYGYVTRETH